MTTGLTLPQEFLLLALRDVEGTVPFSLKPTVPYALAGAALLELSLRGRVRLDRGEVRVIDRSPTGDAVLDAALVRTESDARAWIRLALDPRSTIDQLVERGILRRERHRIFWERHPARDPAPEARVRERLRNPQDVRSALLLELAQVAGIVPPSNEPPGFVPETVRALRQEYDLQVATIAAICATIV